MKKVMIVEDKKLIRQGIHAMTERCGVPIEEIIECRNGREALDYLQEEEVDLVITDIQMPVMDGITLVQNIQGLERKPEIIALSAYDNFQYAVELMRQGIRHYLLKPVEREELGKLLEQLDVEIGERNRVEERNQMFWMGQLKYLLGGQIQSEVEEQLLRRHFAGKYENTAYVLCASPKPLKMSGGDPETGFIGQLAGDYLYIFAQREWEESRDRLENQGVLGISGMHRGMEQLHLAYEEAIEDRKSALMREAVPQEELLREKMQQAIYYINGNYNRDINLAVVSNHVSMNYNVFSTCFKQHTGMNFVNYLKNLRIEEAKNLLRRTDDRIRDISHKVGYENEHHFMKTFKAVCGMSPSEYRKIYR